LRWKRLARQERLPTFSNNKFKNLTAMKRNSFW
jgi:hypothetical protein